MDHKKNYQKPEATVIKVETEGEVFVLSGTAPGSEKNPGDIGVNSSYFKNSGSILGGDE